VVCIREDVKVTEQDMSPSPEASDKNVMVALRDRLLVGPMFDAIFKEGMALVEETATYLDGPGRAEAKKLERKIARAYAEQSTRVTTRLMNCTSWLLLHRDVKEESMSLAEAAKERTRVRINKLPTSISDDFGSLPETLQDLILRTGRLELKLRRLDAVLYQIVRSSQPDNPVHRQLGLLKVAFEID
jgi:regulator of CtrA degradation